jgi:hypothetical protein
VKLGNPNGARALRGKQTGKMEAVAKIKEKAARRATDLQGVIDGIKRSGTTSVRAITDELNRQGISAPRRGLWHPTAVARLLNRLSRTARAFSARIRCTVSSEQVQACFCLTTRRGKNFDLGPTNF